MALRFKLRSKPLLPPLRSTPYSSTSSSPPPDSAAAEETNEPAPPPPPPSPSYSSYFSDIKDRLKSPPSPPRRIPSQPAPPPRPSDPAPAASLNDIRKHLAAFRLNPSSPPPTPPRSSDPPVSFQELFKKNVVSESRGGAASDKPERPSFDSIRESLRQFRPSPATHPGRPSFSLRVFRDSLKDPAAPPPILYDSDRLPDSIFGKELRERKEEGGEEAKKGPRTDFVKLYSYDELGEKLRQLRPDAAKKGGNDWFSLTELNERLAKLREMEERETESRMGGVSFRDLRESLVRLKEADANKKADMRKWSLITNLGGQMTPTFMLKPPQEHLLENYFHPDHMSSAEKMKLELKRVRDEFKMSESDCGSSRVQVAQLTTKIKHLSQVLHKKDKHSKKGLKEMVQRRKKLLKYLRRTDWDSYCMVISKLGLRDVPEYKTPGYKT